MYWAAAELISTLSLSFGDVDKAIKVYVLAMEHYLESHKRHLELKAKYKKRWTDHDPYRFAEARIEMLKKL